MSQKSADYKQEIKELKAELAEIAKANEVIAQNLATFDELDFEVFTKQEWARLHESHSRDILVHWPDGHTTSGIEKHIEDLSNMFVYAPDTRIEEHPIRIASGNLTAVMGVIEGTFTEPMPIGEGKFIEPTGKAYKLNMVTIGLWNEKGIMYEEYLFWDNLTFMKQLGLAE
ncbi:MAG: ester cyclase [Cyclobacteriaceae bacterium]|nr:ester cyclase [Cyclobacteriaceae bacterium SS2]